jgi:hypothetical protein
VGQVWRQVLARFRSSVGVYLLEAVKPLTNLFFRLIDEDIRAQRRFCNSGVWTDIVRQSHPRLKGGLYTSKTSCPPNYQLGLITDKCITIIKIESNFRRSRNVSEDASILFLAGTPVPLTVWKGVLYSRNREKNNAGYVSLSMPAKAPFHR